VITPADPVALADWRRQVAEIYGEARRSSTNEPEAAWRSFRAARDQLFAYHTQTALDDEKRQGFRGLSYFDYDRDYRVHGALDSRVDVETMRSELPADGVFSYTRVARVHFELKGIAASLSLFWVEGYGGGLFLPFRDPTNGNGTFGGGRYLIDTIKGADLGSRDGELLLDFNYGYNPSCAYHSQWVCPLAPIENRLAIPIKAGELDFT
jgi:uncharacterized protein (DUF1684 family)